MSYPSVDHIVWELEAEQDRVAATSKLTSSAELIDLADTYNWDDGLAVPHAISVHPSCDLGVALHLFYLAGALEWLQDDQDWSGQEAWCDFCQFLTSRIQDGTYPRGSTRFEPPITRVQVYKARKQGVADVFISPV